MARALLITFCIALLVFSGSFSFVFSQEEVAVTRVMVWVKATDKSGKPALGMIEKDFEIYEDGKRMEPNCFEETRLDFAQLEEPAEIETAPDPEVQDSPSRKRIVFLLDLSNTSQVEFLHLKEKTNEFLSQLSKTWEVSLVSLYNGVIEVNVEGTTDQGVLRSALERVKANNMRDIDTLNNRRQISSLLETAGGDPRQTAKVIANACALAEEFIQREKIEARMWLDSLRQFDKYVRREEGEPHTVVLFLSGGISSNPGKQYYEVIVGSSLIQEMFPDEREFNIQYPECRYLYESGQNRDFEKLVGKLNTNNITFYTINSRGPINDLLETVRESDRRYKLSDLNFLKDYQDLLVLIADDTGGTHFENSLNFKKGFDAILQDLNHQYLLCYSPPEHSGEGYHKIQVKSVRSGVKLRHRVGYYE